MQVEFGVRAEADRFEVPADEQTVAVVIVDPEHPAVLNFFFLLNQLAAADGNRQALFHDQTVAAGGDQHITVGLLPCNHILGIDTCLRRREGVVAETHPFGAPSVSGEPDSGGLDAPAADGAIDQLRFAQALQLGDFHHSEAVLVLNIGVDLADGNATAPFDREAALERHVADALINLCDRCRSTLLLIGRAERRWFRGGLAFQMIHSCTAIAQGNGLETLRKGCGLLTVVPLRVGATQGGWHDGAVHRGKVTPPAVTEAQQVGIAPLRHAAVGPERPGAVVDPANEGEV